MQGPSSYNVLNYFDLPILRDFFFKKMFFLVFKVYQGQLLQKVFRINRYAQKKYFYPDKRAFLCLREDAKPRTRFSVTIYIKRFKKIIKNENIFKKFLQRKSIGFVVLKTFFLTIMFRTVAVKKK